MQRTTFDSVQRRQKGEKGLTPRRNPSSVLIPAIPGPRDLDRVKLNLGQKSLCQWRGGGMLDIILAQIGLCDIKRPT